MDENALCRLRGNRMAMVFQEPMTALNPVHGIGRQVAEPLRHHLRLGRQAARAHADRKSTRLNSSHSQISYAVFCLKKKKIKTCQNKVRIILSRLASLQ